MFSNPILKSYKSILRFLGIWLGMALLVYLIMSKFLDVPKDWLGADIFLQNLVFGALLLGLWYPVAALNPETQSLPWMVLNHIIIFLFLTFLWISISHALLRTLFPVEGINAYLNAALPYKINFVLLGYMVFVISVNFYRYYVSFLEKKEVEANLYKNIKETELSLLRSQMNPHFIFNSLNSISSLTIIDPEKAQEMIILLSDFLRYTVSYAKDQTVPLQKELEMCRAYLDIEKIRFGSKIVLNWDVDPESLNIHVPSMMLQTLFENAIKHGIHDSLQAETLRFSSALKEGRLHLSVFNSTDGSQEHKTGTGTGLRNIKERLELIYDKQALLSTEAAANTYTVNINLPLTQA
jgi:two-component system, LytTR family, sensor kinase